MKVHFNAVTYLKRLLQIGQIWNPAWAILSRIVDSTSGPTSGRTVAQNFISSFEQRNSEPGYLVSESIYEPEWNLGFLILISNLSGR